jgi:hypothetical protein
MRQERNDKIGKGLKEDIYAAARTHLNSYATEGEILTLDKNYEYCQIWLISAMNKTYTEYRF